MKAPHKESPRHTFVQSLPRGMLAPASEMIRRAKVTALINDTYFRRNNRRRAIDATFFELQGGIKGYTRLYGFAIV